MPTRHTLFLTRACEPFGARLQAPLPPSVMGRWCRLRLVLPADAASVWAKLQLEDPARAQIVREAFLGSPRIRGARCERETLVHVPAEAGSVTLLIFAGLADEAEAVLTILSRPAAAVALLLQGWRHVPAAITGDPRGLIGRLRAVLGRSPTRAGQRPPYTVWINLFEPAAPPEAPAGMIQPVIFPGGEEATRATVASLAGQSLPCPAPLRITSIADWNALSPGWVLPLQPGETLHRDALAVFAHASLTAPWAGLLTADCDRLTAAGIRAAPLLKPGPDPILLRSGLPVRGACSVRWSVVPADTHPHAHAVRLALALAAPSRTAHIPRVLSHLRHDTAAPPAVPRAAAAPADPSAGVTILVPTAARARHVLPCLRAVIGTTDFPIAATRLIVSGGGNPGILRRAAQLPGVVVTQRPVGSFNYARVNNEAAATVDTDFLLLLNDDVAPIAPDWLHAMLTHMHDPTVGIVGARLLYGNGMVQHEGVTLGLANLCEHTGRLRRGSDPGPHGLGLLDRQVSAVTAACLLIRTSLYQALGGMDEAFAIALNDVDLCLRARQAGWRVIYCASAVLHHFESLSLGRHYAGARAALESREVRLLRGKFASIIDADPFYTPMASLQPGDEWQPAFPPRLHSGVLGDEPALG